MSTTSPDVFELGPAVERPQTASAGSGRIGRFVRGPSDDPSWARPALLGLLLATAVLYLWSLSSDGWANSFYSAAVQAGTKSWKAMLFGSLDSGNAITVDKPPASLWLMEISGRIFGFSSWSMLVPQALLGAGTVGLVYAAVKRFVGPGFGLLAGAALAVTPVAVLMFRFNNPDALLTFLLVLAIYAVLRAQENGSTRWLVGAGVCIGFAFLTKTLQAFLILPALTAVYAATGPGKLLRRVWQLLASGAALLVSAGWWVAIVQLTPASARPYVGGSQNNSFLELTFGYNGFGRLTGNETGSVGGGRSGQAPGLVVGTLPQGATPPNGVDGLRPGGPGGGFSNGTGLTRMFGNEVGSQISWLIPAALFLFVAGLWAAGRAKRTDPARAALLGWGLSLLSTMAVFSYMKGIFHPYYTIALAPLIAAVVGLGGGLLWQRREQLLPRVGLAIAVAGTGWWSFVLLERTSAWHPWIRYTVAVTAGLAALALVFAPMVGRLTNRASATARWGTIALGVVAALLGPGAYAVATAGTGHTGSIPSAGPQSGGFGGPGGFGGGGPRMVIQNGAAGQPGFPGGRGGFPGGVAPNGSAGQNGGLGSQAAPNANGQPGGQAVPGGQGNVLGGTGGGQLGDRGGINNLLDASTPSATIQAMLKKDASSYRWTAAAIGAQNAAGYQLATGDPVMAIGGFNGSDPSPTLAQFQAYVAAHKIHYYIGGGIGMQSNGGADEGGDIGTWVKAHYTAQTVDGVTLYDLSAAPIG